MFNYFVEVFNGTLNIILLYFMVDFEFIKILKFLNIRTL
jgi:hypothetical protein